MQYDPTDETTNHRPSRGSRGADAPRGEGGPWAGGRRRHHPEGHGPHFGGRRQGGRGPRGDGRRGRAQRGDVRAATLLLLADEPMHGYQLMQAIADRTQGAWRPSPGAIYPTLAQLEDEGLVSVVAEAGRKLATLTAAGRDYLAANQATMVDPFTAITSEAGGTQDLRGSVEQVFAAARAVLQTGNDAQIAAAQDVLGQARRALYLILAEGPTPSTDGATADPM
jgi:DNA-binding PadR family transcriptional regulator